MIKNTATQNIRLTLFGLFEVLKLTLQSTEYIDDSMTDEEIKDEMILYKRIEDIKK